MFASVIYAKFLAKNINFKDTKNVKGWKTVIYNANKWFDFAYKVLLKIKFLSYIW